MLKSNHVQQNTAAYVKLPRGHQHMPEKMPCWLQMSCWVWMTAVQYKKLLRPRVSELLWGDEHFHVSVGDQGTQQSGRSCPWSIFLLEKKVSLTALSACHRFPSLDTLQLLGVGGFLHCNEKCTRHNSGAKCWFELMFIYIFTLLFCWKLGFVLLDFFTFTVQ